MVWLIFFFFQSGLYALNEDTMARFSVAKYTMPLLLALVLQQAFGGPENAPPAPETSPAPGPFHAPTTGHGGGHGSGSSSLLLRSYDAILCLLTKFTVSVPFQDLTTAVRTFERTSNLPSSLLSSL